MLYHFAMFVFLRHSSFAASVCQIMHEACSVLVWLAVCLAPAKLAWDIHLQALCDLKHAFTNWLNETL